MTIDGLRMLAFWRQEFSDSEGDNPTQGIPNVANAEAHMMRSIVGSVHTRAVASFVTKEANCFDL